MDRRLEIKSLKSYDAGSYFCIKETGQQDDITTADIMGQINLHIVRLNMIDIVLDYDVNLLRIYYSINLCFSLILKKNGNFWKAINARCAVI
jgi:hypothetical protein